MATSRFAKAASLIMFELDAAAGDPGKRTFSALASGMSDRFTPEEVRRGLRLLKKRGHAETDPAWRKHHMPQKAVRLTVEGQERVDAIVARRAAREVEQYRSSSMKE